MKRKKFNLETSYSYQAYVLARTLRKDFFDISRRSGHDLFPEQWFALYFIVNNPGQTQTELASGAFEDRPSLSRTLNNMIEKNLVVARKDDNDRRTVRYSATRSGIQLFNSMVSTMTAERERVFANLTERDHKEFTRIVNILVQNMS